MCSTSYTQPNVVLAYLSPGKESASSVFFPYTTSDTRWQSENSPDLFPNSNPNIPYDSVFLSFPDVHDHDFIVSENLSTASQAPPLGTSEPHPVVEFIFAQRECIKVHTHTHTHDAATNERVLRRKPPIGHMPHDHDNSDSTRGI